MLKQIILKPNRDESLKRFHPWIFSGAILRCSGKPDEGEVVDIYTGNNQFIARGHYQTGSIACRILTFEDENIDMNFWRKRISNAYRLRQKSGIADRVLTTAYRLIHGEGDMLPGLIIDIYGKTAVIQAHSVGMFRERRKICDALTEIFGNKLAAVYDKSSATVPFKASTSAADEYLFGSKNANDEIAMEYGNKFVINWEEGQKTGFFVDQRDNRALLEQYAKDKDVLNMFCYTGGFSCFAMRGGAKSVHSVDSSSKAIMLTDENISLNFPGDDRYQSFTEDAFRYMEKIDGRYDLIILDPPAFAKHRNVLKNALQGYRKLNAVAFEKIRPGGLLFTFSCSQVVTKEQFRLAVFSAAAQSGRNVRILHQLTQAADHPINIYHPEGEYIKGMVLAID
jgi:23S rRNA (cytosine1962-C5)-methyltransferase